LDRQTDGRTPHLYAFTSFTLCYQHAVTFNFWRHWISYLLVTCYSWYG